MHRNALLTLCLALSLPTLAVAGSYTVTDLGTLGGPNSAGHGINASGQVTGYARMAGNLTTHAFLYDGTMNDLGTPGGSYSEGRGINASGQVTGYGYTTGDAALHAFLYNGTMMNDLGTLGGTDSFGNSINASGQVAGYAHTPGNYQHAFLYDSTMHDLGTLGGTGSRGNGINDSGQVTGHAYTTGNDAQHAFLWTPTTPNGASGTMHDLGTLGATGSEGNAINASGQVTGILGTSGDAQRHAFLWTPTTPNGASGTMHDLGTLGGTFSYGRGINASGQVTGHSYTTGDAALHAFLYDAVAGMVDLNSLIDPSSGWLFTHGADINNAGQITGYGFIGGEQHAFLLNVVPEPSSLVLMAMALVFVLLHCARRWRALTHARSSH